MTLPASIVTIVDIPPGARPIEFTATRPVSLGIPSLPQVLSDLTATRVLRTTPSARSLFVSGDAVDVHCRCGAVTKGDATRPIACVSCGAGLAEFA